MTPLDVSRGIASYLKECIKDYDETISTIDATAKKETVKDVHVYSGYLPRKTKRQDIIDLCPAIVVRPETFKDGKDDSRVSIAVFVTVYDEDMEQGCETLFHFMDFVRMMLLSDNPVNDKWYIANGLEGTVTDEQPYPQWIGVIEFEVYIPQPKRYNSKLLGGDPFA